MYNSIPNQLNSGKKRYVISAATKKHTTSKDREKLSELVDSKTVLMSCNTTDPSISLSAAADNDSFKLYLADTGLFVSLLFNSQDRTGSNIYSKLLSDSLDANLGYLYENAAAQILASCGCKLFYHTWKKENSQHSYEIDFLIAAHAKLVPIEIKSSAVNVNFSKNRSNSLSNFKNCSNFEHLSTS